MSATGIPRASPLARQAFAAYAALIVYASLYPFEGWVSLGIGPFDYLFAPMQRYVTAFDVVTNVLGYLPFGALAVLALHPRWRGVAATLIAAGLGVLLSGSMEALQTYLPTRVASNLDLAANALGALLGATPLLLAGLWPFAILFPSPFLFGIGDWPAALWERADASMQDALLTWLPAAWRVGEWPERVDGWLSDSGWEAALGGLMLFAALTIASLAMRPRAPRIRLLIVLVAATLVLKAAATFMQSATGLVVVWATPGARLGIELGFAAALVALHVPATWRAAFAALALLAGVALVNLLPVNPFFDFTLSGWRQGRYVHFNSLARWLAWIWPYAALIWLGQRVEHAWLPAALRR